MLEYEIRTDIAAPPPNMRRGRQPEFPLRYLPIGGSILVPAPKAKSARNAYNLLVFRDRAKFKFTTQTLPDGSVRIWRIAV